MKFLCLIVLVGLCLHVQASDEKKVWINDLESDPSIIELGIGLYIDTSTNPPSSSSFYALTQFEIYDAYSFMAFKTTRNGFEDKMPAVAFTMKYDEASDKNFVR